MKKIGFIGAGRVGFSLGKFFKDNSLFVSGYYSRTNASAKEAALFTKSHDFDSILGLINASDIIFITVPDNELVNISNSILKIQKDLNTKKCFVQCSGACSIKDSFYPLMDKTNHSYASLHPMMAFSSKYESYKDINNTFFTLEADADSFSLLSAILDLLCVQYTKLDSDVKAKYHLASVMCSNCVVGIFDFAKELLKECSFSDTDAHKALSNLFIANARNIVDKGVKESLTGPLVRGDDKTIKKHLNELSDDDILLYKLLSQKILKVAKEKQPTFDYSQIEKIINTKI